MYRNLLELITGKRSAKGLSENQLNAVVTEMKRRGFKPKSSKPQARAAEVAKIRAIVENLGLSVATPEEARGRLGLKGGDRVAF